jgi:hypothetical protein
METPRINERVRVAGHGLPFFVIAVDEERHELDLMPVSGKGPCLEAVPFSAITRHPAISDK